jgi:hypothetical protein
LLPGPKKAIVSVWSVLRLQPVYPLRLCICSRKSRFEHSSPIEIPNSKLEQILAFLSLKSCSRSVSELFENQNEKLYYWCLCMSKFFLFFSFNLTSIPGQ